MRTAIALALSLSLFAFAGCKKKEGGDKAAPKAGETAAKPDEAKPAAGPAQMEAPALFDDYNKPGQDGLALLDKWKPGVIVTGTVTNVITEEAGNSHVWVDGGNNHKVTLDFTDQGKAAKDKGVKAGDKVTAQCSIGGSDGNMMMLTDCTLK
ncbi:MAG TPA: hypothetical protein VFV99_33240 [Kofleriaceae bacterium]|nr:hypothetical protein [Kofleriaceae bacterium]